MNETNELTDNTEKSTSRIRESSDSYDDGFDKKLDAVNSKELSRDTTLEKDSYESDGNKKLSLLDKMRNLVCHKENGGESGGDKTERNKSSFSETRDSFLDRVKKDAPSMKEQAEAAKNRREGKSELSDDGNESNDAESSREHGEDGERTLWSDAQWARGYERE